MFKKTLATIFISLFTATTAVQASDSPPFLILKTIPHLTGMVKANWDNSELNLSEKQKINLLKIRKETMAGVKAIKTKLAPLVAEVSNKILSDAKPEELTGMVDEIAKYKAEATRIHLKCVYETKKELTLEQYKFLTTGKS